MGGVTGFRNYLIAIVTLIAMTWVFQVQAQRDECTAPSNGITETVPAAFAEPASIREIQLTAFHTEHAPLYTFSPQHAVYGLTTEPIAKPVAWETVVRVSIWRTQPQLYPENGDEPPASADLC